MTPQQQLAERIINALKPLIDNGGRTIMRANGIDVDSPPVIVTQKYGIAL
ncbi:MAG: hypothetical protein AB8B83_09180 [Bdellovibrionales bacterium]